MRFHWYCSLWKDKAKSQSTCSVNTEPRDTKLELHRSGKDTAKYAHGFALSLCLWCKHPTSVLVFPAADAKSKRLDGAARSKGFRWRRCHICKCILDTEEEARPRLRYHGRNGWILQRTLQGSFRYLWTAACYVSGLFWLTFPLVPFLL